MSGSKDEDLFSYLPPESAAICRRLEPLAREKGIDPASLPALLCLVALQQAMLAEGGDET